MLYGKIPRHIDIDGLVNTIRGNKTKRAYIRDGMVYMISRIHNEQLKKYQRQNTKNPDSFIKLNYKTLEQIIGKGKWDRVLVIKQILLDNDIIETDGTYLTNLKSYGYRIKREHISDDLVKYPLGERISSAIENILKKNKVEVEELDEIDEDVNDDLLGQQFNLHSIKWDESVFDDLRSICYEILQNDSRRGKLKNNSILSVLHTCGGLLRYIYDVENRDFIYGVSPSNNRYNTILTSAPKVLRSYLTLNDRGIVEVDMMTSQPYLLSTILNEKFEKGTEQGYNLKTIYPSLLSLFELRRKVLSGLGLRIHEFFGCPFLENDIELIKYFCDIDFTQDFYENVVDLGLELNIETTRERVKKTIMNYLFNYNKNYRNNSQVIQILDIKYRGMFELIDSFHTFYKSKEFALLLQRVESYLVLRNVVPKILIHNNHIPVFTIHDCIITSPQYVEEVRDIMSNTISSITHKPVGLKTIQINPDRDKLMEYILESSSIKYHYQVEKRKKYWLKSSIIRGYEFLYPEFDMGVWSLIEDYKP